MIRAKTVVAMGFTMLLALLALLAAPPALANQSVIQASAEYSDGRIHVLGEVTSEGVPVRNVSVSAHLAGTSAAAASDELGRFSLSVPVPEGLSGSLTLTLVFEGRDNISGTQTSLHVHVPDLHVAQDLSLAAEPADVQPAAESAPQPEPIALDVEASLSRSTSYPGGLLGLTGTVADTHGGNRMGNVRVDASFGGIPLNDSTTFTDEQGQFVTFVEIPAAATEGESTILVVANAGGRGTATLDLPVAIGPVPVPHTPTPQPAAPPAATQEEAQGVEPAGAEEAHSAPTTAGSSMGAGARQALAAVVIVGGVALLTMLALAFRSWSQRHSDETGESWLEDFGERSADHQRAGRRPFDALSPASSEPTGTSHSDPATGRGPRP